MKRLPKLTDFKAIEAEPDVPEPIWKRVMGCLAISVICGCLFGGYELYRSLGLSTKRQPFEVRHAAPEEKMQVVKERAAVWFCVGFFPSFVLLTIRELNTKK